MDPVHEKWASAFFNGDFFLVEAKSGYRSCVSDSERYQCQMAAGATDEELGQAVVEALTQSRFVTPENSEEFDRLFDPARIAASYAAWTASLLEKNQYKNKNSLFKKMLLCNISMIAGEIKISPTIHKKLELWGREKGDGIEDFFVAVDSPVEKIGQTLRTAFSRCEQ
ncbi:contact-dependent growth inhibition system immunity protein [Variovorax atrisoli]|uniref:contact-dependent growth inhibition system immunity protein n=1 Tax=Variovorax atrisoli TaxID=3394203 RepID=UPI003391E181